MTVSVGGCVCPRAYLRNHTYGQTSPNFMCISPMAVDRSFSGGDVINTSGFVDNVMFLFSRANSGGSLLQQRHCSVIHWLTLLLRGICCAVSYTRAGASPSCKLGVSGRSLRCTVALFCCMRSITSLQSGSCFVKSQS